MKQEFQMLQTEMDDIISINKNQAPVMKFGDYWSGMDLQEKINHYWETLGNKYGFKHLTVEPSAKGKLFFIAEPKPIVVPKTRAEIEIDKYIDGTDGYLSGAVICWWSGGVTSAVACKLAIDLYGLDACRFIMIDTKNEDEDSYRFKADCEKWYGKGIELITNEKYEAIQDVWLKFKSLNVATGAICSSELKREVRQKWEKENDFDHQVFGFDIDEPKRAKSLKLNYAKTKPIFPLLFMGYSKKDCLSIIEEAGIVVPRMYQLGFSNNNCFQTGCIQGGIGYWQKMMREFPDKFNKMAEMEHNLTNIKGKPVTMLKDQSKYAKESGRFQVFLKKHPDYPHLKDVTEMPECKVEPLMECNGFCGTNDLERNPTEKQLSFEL